MGLIGSQLPAFPHVQLRLLRQLLEKWGWKGIDGIMRAAQLDMGMRGMAPPGMGGPPAPGGLDGRLRADAFNPNDQLPQQALRAGINMPNEGRG